MVYDVTSNVALDKCASNVIIMETRQIVKSHLGDNKVTKCK